MHLKWNLLQPFGGSHILQLLVATVLLQLRVIIESLP